MALNRISLMGRLTKDPELRTTPNGSSVALFTLAVDRDYKNQSGERDTDFIPVVAWRGTADFVSSYFEKGQMAVVDGRLQIRGYTDKDGIKRSIAEVVADHVYFGSSKKEQGRNPGRAEEDHVPAGYSTGPVEFAETEDDGDLPF